MVISSIAGVAHGFLLAWVLTLERSDSNLAFGILSIMGLLLIFHLISMSMFGRSIFIITSYTEGLFLFFVTMISFRIGDYLLGITDLSFRTEIFLFSVAVVFAFFYVWAMRRMVKER
jgi:hypothetical protein